MSIYILNSLNSANFIFKICFSLKYKKILIERFRSIIERRFEHTVDVFKILEKLKIKTNF